MSTSAAASVEDRAVTRDARPSTHTGRDVPFPPAGGRAAGPRAAFRPDRDPSAACATAGVAVVRRVLSPDSDTFLREVQQLNGE